MKIRRFIDFLKKIEKEDLDTFNRNLLARILNKLTGSLGSSKERSLRREVLALERENLNKMMVESVNELEKIDPETEE